VLCRGDCKGCFGGSTLSPSLSPELFSRPWCYVYNIESLTVEQYMEKVPAGNTKKKMSILLPKI